MLRKFTPRCLDFPWVDPGEKRHRAPQGFTTLPGVLANFSKEMRQS